MASWHRAPSGIRRHREITDTISPAEAGVRHRLHLGFRRGLEDLFLVVILSDDGSMDTVHRGQVPMFDDCRLIAIPSREVIFAGKLGGACRAAEAGGATCIQIRIKGATASELLRAVQLALASVNLPVYVNDRADVALVAGAHGVHVGADDLPAAVIRSFVPRPMRVGVSVGADAEARLALAADADYWSLGPFHATSTKGDAGSALGEVGFRALASRAPDGMPIVAIGGITPDNVRVALEAGASGVAVISGIFGAMDMEAATRRLRRALDDSR